MLLELSKPGHYDGSMAATSLEGMSIRDYFAAKAMSAYIPMWTDAAPDYHAYDIAKFAYRIADAMLAERSK